MDALKHLLNRYNECDKLTDLETLVVIARDETAAEELNALRDAKLIATHLLIDIQTFFNSEVKVCNGIGFEFELGMLDSISAYLELHGTEGNVKGDE